MMIEEIESLMVNLQSLGIKLSLKDNGDLLVRGNKDRLDNDLVNRIKSSKADIVSLLQQKGRSKVSMILPRKPCSKNLRLSFAQQRLWLLDQIEGGSAHYNMPAALRLSGELDREGLQFAFGSILERHESLRTVFAEGDDGEPVQVILTAAEFKLTEHDLSALELESRSLELAERMNEEAERTFDLKTDLMLRAQLLKLSNDEHIVLVTMHHIASDGWSMGILVNEFSRLYSAYVLRQKSPLLPLSIQYADYAQWQREWLQGEVLNSQLGYWQKQLEDVPPVHSIPLDHPRPEMKVHIGGVVEGSLDLEISKRLQQRACELHVTPFMLIHAALGLVIGRHSNSQDIVIGTPVANRLQTEVEPLIGFFVNTLVLRTSTAYLTFSDYLSHVRQVNLDAQENQDVPFEQLVEYCQIPRSMQHAPLFQIMFNMDTNQYSELSLPGLKLSTIDQNNPVAKFDLDISATIADDGINIAWVYDKSLFCESHVVQLNDHLIRVLTAITLRPEAKIAELPMLSDIELSHLLHELNNNAVNYPQGELIHELFEAQASQKPDDIALSFNGEQMSYQQLNQSANRLAHYLRAQGVAAQTLVGICVERSMDMVVAILAIYKAGGAYVPMDPNYPEARLTYILEDTEIKYLVTQTGLSVAKTSTPDIFICELDSERHKQLVQTYPEYNPNRLLAQQSSDLAYVIYTSGSTGQPKGVLIEHRNAVSFIHWALDYFDKDELSCVLASTSLNFDLSVFELMVPLVAGGRCLIVDNILSLIERDYEGITLINTVPSGISALLSSNRIPTSVISVNLAGEPLKKSLVDSLQQTGNFRRIVNLYGPSEDTTYSTVLSITSPLKHNPSIGKPISNTQAYILDAAGQLVPEGTIGELYLGGCGLSRGYLNREEMTRQKYVQNPYSIDDRLYRTGDFVRWNSDGELNFVGRIDDQLKIRGFRIELGEIEFHLSSHEDIESSLVLAREDEFGQKSLIAYVVPSNKLETLEVASGKYKQHLHNNLPPHMVPSVFVVLSEWPLLPNGKINKRALPEPDGTLLQRNYIEPQGSTERQLVNIWAKLLKLQSDSISATDNFFELGGHSLLAVRLINEIRTTFDLKMDWLGMRDIFSSGELRDLGKTIDLILFKEKQEHLRTIIEDSDDLEEGEL